MLQFAFSSDGSDLFLPHNFTITAWCIAARTITIRRAVGMSRRQSSESATSRGAIWGAMAVTSLGDLIRLAFSSVADMAVVPLQDVLNLGTQARMNLPGRASGNWGWRFEWSQINDGMRERLKELAMLYGR